METQELKKGCGRVGLKESKGLEIVYPYARIKRNGSLTTDQAKGAESWGGGQTPRTATFGTTKTKIML